MMKALWIAVKPLMIYFWSYYVEWNEFLKWIFKLLTCFQPKNFFTKININWLFLFYNMAMKRENLKKKASLNAKDFEQFREQEVSKTSIQPSDESVSYVSNYLKDVNSLFISKAQGKIIHSAEEKEDIKGNTIKGITELIGQLSGLVKKK